jgi:hypothetical protein
MSGIVTVIFIGSHYKPTDYNLTVVISSIIITARTWSSGYTSWLLTQRSRVRVQAPSDFLSSSGSGTGSTLPL